MSIEGDVKLAMNAARREIYGPSFSVILLRENGVERPYDEGPEITVDFMVSVDRTGKLTLLIISKSPVILGFLETATHVVFKGWVYSFSEPAKPERGAVDMWKATGKGTGIQYVYVP